MEWAGDIQRAKAELENENLARARRICERVLASQPEHSDALEILATAETRRLRFASAVPHFKRLLKKDPGRATAWATFGFCLQRLRRLEEALRAYDAALEKNPVQYDALFASAYLLIAAGEPEKAKPRLEKAIAADPGKYTAYRLLATITKFTKGHPFLREMEARLSNIAQPAPDELPHLYYALASAYEQLGMKEKFVEAIEAANRLQRENAPGWEEGTRLMAEMSKQVFTPELFKRRTTNKAKQLTPIFIVGLPRSGSTLVEQILASHSRIFGADELTLVRDFFVDSHPALTGTPYPQKVAALSDEVLNSLAEKYQSRLAEISPGYDHVCDKQLDNALYVGMIHLVMPWAKVIHIRRHPYDTALSIYKNYFDPAVAYAADLKGLALYFRITQNLMDHWEQVVPGFVLDVRYEDIIRNPEKEIRKILRFIGLSFEKSCLEFYKTRRAVFTHSALQVRQKPQASAIGRWKDYRDMLAPFIEGTKDLLEDYGY